MFSFTPSLIRHFRNRLCRAYRDMYGHWNNDFAEIIGWAGKMSLEILANTDALYHNAEHTMIVTLVGQEILRGKHMREGGIAPDDWLHYILSLLFHDIGFVKGVCRQDRPDQDLFAAGRNGAMISLPPGSSDASLNPYHVDRGKLFVQERFGGHRLIRAEVICRNIELTRFPVPAAGDQPDSTNYPGLVRAADLIGQLSDPRYLKKLVALFHEFEETGVNKVLGYRNPGDLRRNYPQFYWQAVHPHVADSIGYLQLTQRGKQILANLFAQVFMVKDLMPQQTSEGEPSSQGQPLSHWVAQLKGKDRYDRMQAAAALAQLGPQGAPAVSVLIETLRDPDESIRQWSAHVLESIGPAAQAAAPALRKALADDNPFVRLSAAEALGKIDDLSADALENIVALLPHNNWLIRTAAARALGKLGVNSAGAARGLAERLRDGVHEVRRISLESLSQVAPSSVIDALISALHSDDRLARTEAAFALGERGSESRPAVPVLVDLLRDPSWLVRRAVLLTLAEIGPEAGEVLPALLELLDEENDLILATTIEVIGQLGPAANPAATALQRFLGHSNPDISRAAADAIQGLH